MQNYYTCNHINYYVVLIIIYIEKKTRPNTTLIYSSYGIKKKKPRPKATLIYSSYSIQKKDLRLRL